MLHKHLDFIVCGLAANNKLDALFKVQLSHNVILLKVLDHKEWTYIRTLIHNGVANNVNDLIGSHFNVEFARIIGVSFR